MADFYGANYTKTDINVPSEKINDGEFGGQVKIAYDSYSFGAAITTADALYMMKLPAGALVLDVIVKCDDLGTTGDFNIGWQAGAGGLEVADADGFFAALDVNAAAITVRASDVVAPSAGLLKRFAEEVQVVVVPSENTTATSGSIQIAVEYVII